MPATAIFICFRASCFLSLQFDLPVFHIPVLFSLKQLQLLSFSTVYRNHSSAILILYSKSELVTTAIFITTAIAFCRTLPNILLYWQLSALEETTAILSFWTKLLYLKNPNYFTVTLHFLLYLPLETVITVVPLFFPFITPLVDTVATFLFEDL